jgi:hypothetical protein
MLDRATAADSKMLAKRFDPLGACALDPYEAPAVGMMTGRRGDLDDLTAQRKRHIDGLPVEICDAIAKMADVIDEKPLNHVALRGRIRYCRRRP